MILARLSGGLGNQMFQYAAARSFADGRRVGLRLDLTEYRDGEKWPGHDGYVLEAAFGPLAPEMGRIGRLVRDGWRRRPGRLRFLKEGSPALEAVGIEGLLDAAPNWCYLKGYWQDERWFLDIADRVRAEFTIPDERLRAWGTEIDGLIAECRGDGAVAVHVRRGDYLTVGRGFFALLEPDYYRRAGEYLAERVDEPRFMIFSDDPDWCLARVVECLPGPTRIIGPRPDVPSWVDQALMARCDHHVLANSTFGWWGAWIGETASSFVVAPERWYADPSVDAGSRIVPDRWTRC